MNISCPNCKYRGPAKEDSRRTVMFVLAVGSLIGSAFFSILSLAAIAFFCYALFGSWDYLCPKCFTFCTPILSRTERLLSETDSQMPSARPPTKGPWWGLGIFGVICFMLGFSAPVLFLPAIILVPLAAAKLLVSEEENRAKPIQTKPLYEKKTEDPRPASWNYVAPTENSDIDKDRFQTVLRSLKIPKDASLLGTTLNEESLKRVSHLFNDHSFLEDWGTQVPIIQSTVQREYHQAAKSFSLLPAFLRKEVQESIRSILEKENREVPPDLVADSADSAVSSANLLSQFSKAKLNDEKDEALSSLCRWLCEQSEPMLEQLSKETWVDEQAELLVLARSGAEKRIGWSIKRKSDEATKKQGLEEIRSWFETHPGELEYIWYSRQWKPDPEVLHTLKNLCSANTSPVSPQDFVMRWSRSVPPREKDILLGISEASKEKLERIPLVPVAEPVKPAEELPPLETIPTPPPPKVEAEFKTEKPEAERAAFRSPEPKRTAAQAEAVKTPPPSAEGPKLWQEHLQPFFVENWYMVAGIVMVVVGSSLLAYYTWDKHWLLRYTIMPTLLAILTASLASLGGWVEQKDPKFRSTAAMLRATAISLLPVNFMAVALLANDEMVSYKTFSVLFMSAVYLGLFGYLLMKWCSAVHRSLGMLLGGTLLFLNSLVMLGPLAELLGTIAGHRLFFSQLLLVLGIGFYLGFLSVGYAVVRFTKTILTPTLASEKIVLWFFGGTLVITFIEVFAWVHSSIRHLPHPYTYAPMVILLGWLILFIERKALQLTDASEEHKIESFLGFAFIFLGILLGASNQYMRIVSFLLASAIWMYQSIPRKAVSHYWISLTLFVLGGASIGLLDIFPGTSLPLLGIGISLLLAWLGVLSRGDILDKITSDGIIPQKKVIPQTLADPLSSACHGMQAMVLLFTTGVTPLTHWHYRDSASPWITALYLLVLAAIFAWKAHREQQLRWVHTSMAILALTLPYFGCVNMKDPMLEGNTMVFGLGVLSALWLFFIRISKSSLALQARSTVLIVYGGIASAAMILRVIVESHTHVDPFSLQAAADYFGPLLMSVALVITTYHSRSLLPAIMCMVILIVLFPELRGTYTKVFSNLAWGSGLGSALSALVLLLLSFRLRDLPALANLKKGDLFLNKTPFPLCRYDHRLFTWPVVASAIYLTLRVDTWTILKHLFAGDIGLKTSIAVIVSSLSWTLVAVFNRTRKEAPAAAHLSWIFLLIGISTAYWKLADTPHWTEAILITGLVLQTQFSVYRFFLEQKYDWIAGLLTQPIRQVLAVSSPIFSILCAINLVGGVTLNLYIPLLLFLAAQLIWHGLSSKNRAYGHCLFWLLWLSGLSLSVSGQSLLRSTLLPVDYLNPSLALFFAVQLLHLALELRKDFHRPLAPLLDPLLLMTSLVTTAFGLWMLFLPIWPLSLPQTQQVLLLVLVLFTARCHASAVLALLSMFLAWLAYHHGALLQEPNVMARVEFLVSPWRLSLFALLMVSLGQAGRLLYQRYPQTLKGPFSLEFFRQEDSSWIFKPAAALAVVATLYHTINPALRNVEIQLWAPYLSGLSFALLAWWCGSGTCFNLAAAAFSLGNIAAVRIYPGDFLRQHGLSSMHLISLGFAASLLEASLLRRLIRQVSAIARLNQISLVLAALILTSLSLNYFVHPDLSSITSERFLISGLMALLAGLYFRRAARHPGTGEEAYTHMNEALYHYGLAMSIWCGALIVPWLRSSTTALIALSIPMLYFYLQAELRKTSEAATAAKYRSSAAALGFLLIGLYVFRSVFQMVLFPQAAISTNHYHFNSPLLMLISLLLLRLHALGGTTWLAFYGGLGLMLGSYFALTTAPGLSPFDFPVAGAWCAILLGHFWTLVSNQQSPLCTALKQLAALNQEAWVALRKSWGMCVLIATQASMFWGILAPASDSYMLAPLLLGGASILLHHGYIRNSGTMIALAGIEMFLALHADFLVASYLPKDQIIWVILSFWAIALAAYYTLRSKEYIRVTSIAAGAFLSLSLVHIFYHHPSSISGLWALAFSALLGGFTPRQRELPQSSKELFFAALVVLVPTWLVFFSQAPLQKEGLLALLRAWPILATAISLLLTGSLARYLQLTSTRRHQTTSREHICLFDHTLHILRSCGSAVHANLLWLVFALSVLVQVFHYNQAFAPRELIAILCLYAASAIAWFEEGSSRKTLAPHYLVQLCVLGFFAVGRRQLMLAYPQFWSYEYDIWASLLVSLSLGGAKQHWDLQPREVRMPLVSTLCAMPVIALIWVLIHKLGTDAALLVVGLHSVNFAFLGKDERESPYNVIAIAGFVAFVVIFFWSKLDLHFVHSYIIPIGLGVLALLQLFRKRIDATTRNQVRLVTLLAMLGSTGYYALLDPRYTVGFNLSFALLCLLAMGLGSFLLIRMYVVLGFTGLMVNLASLSFKALVHMERSSRMTVIGSFVLVAGAALVFGAIYYKTNKENVTASLDAWRKRFGEWE